MSRNAAEFYDQRHHAGESYSGGRYHVADLLRNRAVREWARTRIDNSYRALDIGCGKGVFLGDFCRELETSGGVKPERLVGMDLVQSPGTQFDRLPDVFEFVRADADGSELPFPDDEFDVVTCNHVLEHVFETEYLLDEIRRILRSDGIAIISVPNIAAWINRVLFLIGGQPLGSELGTRSVTYGFRPSAGKSRLSAFTPSGHIRDFTPGGLCDLVAACGFEVRGWWNQDGTAFGKLFNRCSRNMGVIAVPRTPLRSAQRGSPIRRKQG